MNDRKLELLEHMLLAVIEVNDRTLASTDLEFGGDFLRTQSDAFKTVLKMVEGLKTRGDSTNDEYVTDLENERDILIEEIESHRRDCES